VSRCRLKVGFATIGRRCVTIGRIGSTGGNRAGAAGARGCGVVELAGVTTATMGGIRRKICLATVALVVVTVTECACAYGAALTCRTRRCAMVILAGIDATAAVGDTGSQLHFTTIDNIGIAVFEA